MFNFLFNSIFNSDSMNELHKKPETWWTRPCGGFEVLWQAIPLIISSGSISLMNFTDRLFLMWNDPDSMTASMQGGMLFWSAVAIPSAVAMFTTTFVAQYYGSGNYQRIGPIVWQGIWFGVVMLPVLLFLNPYLTQLFVLFGHDEEIIHLERTYFFYLLLGCTATIGGEAAAAFFRGRGAMHVEMYNNVFCVLLNVFLDYCMIFGHLGFPAWGLAGAAIATMISQWVRFGIYVTLMFLTDWKEKRYNILGGMKPNIPLLGRLLYYGTPSSSYTFLDTITFTLFIMIIGGIGQLERNATTIAFTMNAFTFMPLIGIGIVVTSMVGNQLGNNRPDLARRATMTALIIGCVYTGVFGILFIAVPHWLLFAFAAFTDPQEFATVYDLSVILLQFIALYLFFDSCSIIFSSTLRGAGDTVFVMRVVFIVAPLLPLACFAGVHYFGLGLIWCWIALTFDVFAYCVLFTFRFYSKKWEAMRVIEKELQKKI
ncbi:MAG: MATE family efflux transporter [Planctomycetaceae bacterium]|nr:MATE family efflux transporter [Planctomycetaceae bacterium]